MHHSDQLILDIIEAGVRGYIVKSDSDRDLVTALENLSRKKPFFSSHATELILTNYASGQQVKGDGAETTGGRLTPREREIVRLLSEGKSSPAIASVLGLSPKTIDTHRSNIMRKLRVHTASELVRYAVRNQIIEA
jgi:DNA-binding NarL/FixJ family response regulator